MFVVCGFATCVVRCVCFFSNVVGYLFVVVGCALCVAEPHCLLFLVVCCLLFVVSSMLFCGLLGMWLLLSVVRCLVLVAVS